MEEEKNCTPREDEATRVPTPRDELDRSPEQHGGADDEELGGGVRAAVEGFEEGEHSVSDNDDSAQLRRRSSDSPGIADDASQTLALCAPPVPTSSDFDPKRIFVGRLVKGMSAHKLQDVVERYFAAFGVVERIILPVDAQTGLSKGFSFITFTEPAAVKLVLSCPHVIDEVEVDCKPAFPRNSTKSLQDLADVPGTLFKTRKVFVAGLPAYMSDSDLANYFSRYGPVVSGRVIRDKRTGQPRGFGFIEFTTEAAVDKTMSNFSSHYIGERWLMCKRASMNPPKEKGTHVTSMLEPAVRTTLLRALKSTQGMPRRHDMCRGGPPPYPPRGPGRYHHDNSPPPRWQSARRRSPSPMDDNGYRRSYSSRNGNHPPCPCCHDRRPPPAGLGKRGSYPPPPEYGHHSHHDPSIAMNHDEDYYNRRPRYDSPPQMRRRPLPPPPRPGPYDNGGMYSPSNNRRGPRPPSPSDRLPVSRRSPSYERKS